MVAPALVRPQTPTPAWRATLQHVARCTALQDLAVPCVTAEELRLLAHAPAPGASPSRSPPHLADMDEGEDEEDVEEGQEEQRVGGGDAPLGRLQRLHLSGPRVEVADGLGVLEVLLALPRLARLRWEDCSGHCFAPGEQCVVGVGVGALERKACWMARLAGLAAGTGAARAVLQSL